MNLVRNLLTNLSGTIDLVYVKNVKSMNNMIVKKTKQYLNAHSADALDLNSWSHPHGVHYNNQNGDKTL